MPKPIAVRYVQGTFKVRQGRGFSEAELKEAGISVADARKHSLRIDPRRRTKLDQNIRAIKKWLEGPSKQQPSARRRKDR